MPLELLFAVCKSFGMTHLAAYLSKTSTPQAKLAEAVGVSRAYMSELVGGTKTPSLTVAVAIERATDGAVTAASWIEGASQ